MRKQHRTHWREKMNATQVFLNFCSAKATIDGFALTYGEWLDLYEVENGLYWPTSTRSKSHAHFEAKRKAAADAQKKDFPIAS